jgi:hypothetical protein
MCLSGGNANRIIRVLFKGLFSFVLNDTTMQVDAVALSILVTTVALTVLILPFIQLALAVWQNWS